MAELQGIFIDFYGTLVGGDRAAVVAVCEQVIADHGLRISGDELAALWGRSYFDAIEAVDGTFRLLIDIERDTLIETVQPLLGRAIEPEPYMVSMCRYCSQPTLYEEVPEVLAALDLPVCIVSNADERELRQAVAFHQLNVTHIVTSESARSYKPDPRIFETALRVTGWSPDRVVHVGDSLHSDVAGARRAGLKAIWINRAERISDIGTEVPDITWTDLRPLVSYAARANGSLDGVSIDLSQ